MSLKIIYETDRISKIRQQLKEMKREELDFVEYLIDQEREQRKERVFQQFLAELEQFKNKH
ncbi:MAG: hypothetical protein KGZ96_14290 [Clostridia bacterium]|jgi:hypothetical protein|nr:hypothetical protein [Clostridia bacterium]